MDLCHCAFTGGLSPDGEGANQGHRSKVHRKTKVFDFVQFGDPDRIKRQHLFVEFWVGALTQSANRSLPSSSPGRWPWRRWRPGAGTTIGNSPVAL